MIYSKQFIESYAKERGISKAQAEVEVKTFLKVLKKECKENDGITFTGFFTLKKIVRKGRVGSINGRSYETKDKNTLKISLHQAFEEELNK